MKASDPVNVLLKRLRLVLTICLVNDKTNLILQFSRRLALALDSIDLAVHVQSGKLTLIVPT